MVLIIKVRIRNYVLAKPEAHKLTIFKTNVSSFVFEAHCDCADLGVCVFASQMTGRLEFFDVRRKVQTEYLCFFVEGKEDVVLLEIDEFLNICSFSVTFADHFIFINIHKEDLSNISANNKNASFFLIAE